MVFDFDKAAEKAHLQAVPEINEDRRTTFDRIRSHIRTLTLGELKIRPEPRTILMGYFPVEATSALVAMGGIGKTTWLVLQAIKAAKDGIETLFISSEDGYEDYQAKIHNALFSKDLNGQQYLEEDAAVVASKINIMNLRGAGKKLITEIGGSFVPSEFSSDLAEFIANECPNVRLVAVETVSRFAGGEKNEHMEAIVSACDRIAIAIRGACVLVHHIGKAQARERIVDLYSGRGGSALGDNTRSMIVLTRLGKDYQGEDPVLANQSDFDAGRVFEVKHVRNSYGETMPAEYYVTRAGYCHGPVLQRIYPATEDDIRDAKLKRIKNAEQKASDLVFTSIAANGGKVGRRYFENQTKDKIGLTQERGRELINSMIDSGSLIEFEDKSGSQKRKFIKHWREEK